MANIFLLNKGDIVMFHLLNIHLQNMIGLEWLVAIEFHEVKYKPLRPLKWWQLFRQLNIFHASSMYIFINYLFAMCF